MARPAPARCAECRQPITRGGRRWFHRHNASAACHPYAIRSGRARPAEAGR